MESKGSDYTPAPNEDIETGIEMKSGAMMSDESPSNSKMPSKFQMSLSTRKVAQDLKWMNVDFKVKDKQILKDCWGHVPSGSICAIMGGSGAGKSSLLNVLAGRSAPAPGTSITGRVNVSGKDINPVTYRQNIAYVMQEEALLATATPREALEFSARLRLPPSTTTESIKEIVESLLEDLGLMVCADVMIGGPLIKGISGGQKKRTSVGVELITNPSLLFLDEPTSGLDSYSAYSLVSLLRTVADSNTAILCTIHQPSSEVFFLFDLVIFMNQGRILYQGPVNDVVNYFSSFGYKCPPNYNPSDYIMFINQTEDVAKLEGTGMYMDKPPATLFPDSDKVDSNGSVSGEKILTAKSSYWLQAKLLVHRELLNVSRDIGALIGRFGITILLNLLYGLIFLNVGGRDNADNTSFQSHFGGLTMAAISSMFGTAQPTMLAFPYERPMFLREYSTGTYSATSYFLSKTLVELPMAFLQNLVGYLLVYFLMNLQGSFILLLLVSWGLGVASSSVAVILGSAVSDVKDVTELAPLLFVPQLLFAGFFIRLSQVPVFLRWAQYLCSLKYAMNLLLAIEFNLSSNSCSGAAHANCKTVLENNQVDLNYLWLYAFLIAVLSVVFRLLGAKVLVEKARKFY